MKYHYQPVSGTKVRIEVIPEDARESNLLDSLEQQNAEPTTLLNDYFLKGLEAYHKKAVLTKITFMNFPKVALCSFEVIKQPAANLV